MKLSLISTISCALLVTGLPSDPMRLFGEKCSNNQLSCCSNLKSTAEANGNNVDQNGNTIDQTVSGLTTIGGITEVISELTGGTLSQVSNIIPVSILSGCAPLLGVYSFKLSVNYFRYRLLNQGSRQFPDHVCQLYRLLCP